MSLWPHSWKEIPLKLRERSCEHHNMSLSWGHFKVLPASTSNSWVHVEGVEKMLGERCDKAHLSHRLFFCPWWLGDTEDILLFESHAARDDRPALRNSSPSLPSLSHTDTHTQTEIELTRATQCKFFTLAILYFLSKNNVDALQCFLFVLQRFEKGDFEHFPYNLFSIF